MSLDILAALDATAAGPSTLACRVQRFLDNIPADTPGRDRLDAALTTVDSSSPDWRTLEQLDVILVRLGLNTSNKTIGNHRNRRCRCFL